MLLCSYLHGKIYDYDHSWMGYKLYQTFSTDVKKAIWIRAFFGFGSYITSMISIFLMPVSVSVSITMTVTWITAIMSYFINNEMLSWREISMIVIGFFGVIMVVNPAWFNSNKLISLREKHDDKLYPYFGWGIFFAFLFSFVAAMHFITIKKITSNLYVSLNTYYFSLLSLLISVIICIIFDPAVFQFWNIGTTTYPITFDSFVGSFLIGVLSSATQDSVTFALGIVKTGTVAGFYNLALIISFLTDVIYIKRKLVWSDYFGGTIIILCTTLQGYISNQDYELESLRAQ